MNIKDFKPEDLKPVLKLCDEVREHHRQILGGYFMPQDDDMEGAQVMGAFESGKAVMLVAEEAGLAVGFLLAEKKNSPWLEAPRTAVIHNLVVTEKCRGGGIGQKLMDVFYRRCQEAGIQEIKLGVFNKNKAAYHFYEKYGFEPLEQKMSLRVKQDAGD